MDNTQQLGIPVSCDNTRALRLIGRLLLDVANEIDLARAAGLDLKITGGLIANFDPLCDTTGAKHGSHFEVEGKLVVTIIEGLAAVGGAR